MRQQSRRKPHLHIMGLPWEGNGHSYSCCTVEGCTYTVRDGVVVDGKGPVAPQAEQGALFGDMWSQDREQQ